MKREIVLFLLLALFLLLCPVEVSAQNKSNIIVVDYELNNGVVIIDILKEGKRYQLQCNDGLSGCMHLKSGKYVMVELPKNRGTYQCKNIEIYRDFVGDAENGEKLGNYCLLVHE